MNQDSLLWMSQKKQEVVRRTGYTLPQESPTYLNLTLLDINRWAVVAQDQYGNPWMAKVPPQVTNEAALIFKDFYNGTPIDVWLRAWVAFQFTWDWQYIRDNWRDLDWRPM